MTERGKHSMVGNFKSKRQEGFTIIEVLIVLAIAGLIMLIVFLAVPSLQRNSRNTQRRNDVAGMLGAIQEVLTNNNNSIAQITNANLVAAAPTPAFYDYTVAANVSVAAGAATNTNNTSTSSMQVITGGICNGANATSTGANARQMAILYTVEPAIKVCTGS